MPSCLAGNERTAFTAAGLPMLCSCEVCTGCPSPAGGLSPAEAASRLALYGRNVIEIPVPPWWVLLGREATNPFTVFQVRQTGGAEAAAAMP